MVSPQSDCGTPGSKIRIKVLNISELSIGRRAFLLPFLHQRFDRTFAKRFLTVPSCRVNLIAFVLPMPHEPDVRCHSVDKHLKAPGIYFDFPCQVADHRSHEVIISHKSLWPACNRFEDSKVKVVPILFVRCCRQRFACNGVRLQWAVPELGSLLVQLREGKFNTLGVIYFPASRTKHNIRRI